MSGPVVHPDRPVASLANTVPLDPPNYWGHCPKCGQRGGWLNVGRDHWLACHAHQVRWCVGSNLFSGWRDETQEEWERNKRLLAGYEEVEPLRREPVDERPIFPTWDLFDDLDDEVPF